MVKEIYVKSKNALSSASHLLLTVLKTIAIFLFLDYHYICITYKVTTCFMLSYVNATPFKFNDKTSKIELVIY